MCVFVALKLSCILKKWGDQVMGRGFDSNYNLIRNKL